MATSLMQILVTVFEKRYKKIKEADLTYFLFNQSEFSTE